MTYPAFEKIPRFNRDVTITEKIDGTNALVSITETDSCDCLVEEGWIVNHDGKSYLVQAGSRSRWLSPRSDNFGFCDWVYDHSYDLVKLGPGLHYGEWYGKGIQRGYGLDEKRFALFNTHRWSDPASRPECCDVVPVIWQGNGRDLDWALHDCLDALVNAGSLAVPGFMRPEGVIIYHHAAKQYFKVLLENDDLPKGIAA